MSRRLLLAIAILLLTAPSVLNAGQARPTGEGLLLVVSMDESKVDIVDESTMKAVASLNTGKGPHEMVLTVAGDGRRAYLTNPEANSVSIVDLEDGRVTTIPAGKRPDGIAWVRK